jgi:hypothetical protein
VICVEKCYVSVLLVGLGGGRGKAEPTLVTVSGLRISMIRIRISIGTENKYHA